MQADCHLPPNGGDQRLATMGAPHRRISSRVRCIAWFATPRARLYLFAQPIRVGLLRTNLRDILPMRQAGGSAWHLPELLKRLRGGACDDVIDVHLCSARPVLLQLKLPPRDPGFCFNILAKAIDLESLIRIKQHRFCKSGFSEVGHLASMVR